MRLFHRTTKAAMKRILAKGFRDWTGTYGFEGLTVTGVWLSDVPVESQEGAKGDVLLVVDLDVAESEIADFEVVEEGRRIYREWLMPAAFINTHGSVHAASAAEEEEGTAEWSRRAQSRIDEEAASPA